MVLPDDIRERLAVDFELYAPHCLKIKTKSGEIKAFELNKAQRYIHAKAEEQLSLRGWVRLIILKGRQQGASTYIEGRLFWKVTNNQGKQAFILTHENEATKNLFSMAERYYEKCPPFVRPTKDISNAKELLFGGIDSGYKVGTAGNRGAGRSQTLQYFHGCLDGDTPVVCPDGKLVPLRHVRAGHQVVTHTGAVASVSFVSSRVLPRLAVKLRGLQKFPIIGTADHRFWTPVGWQTLGELNIGDEIGYPVANIVQEIHELELPAPFVRPQKGGRQFKPKRNEIPVGYELGRVLGLYLAEGTIIRQSKAPHKPSAVTFTVHDKELKRTLDWLSLFSDYYSSISVCDRPGCMTTTVTVNGSLFARLVEEQCGAVAEKRLPNWKQMGVEFCEGLLHGYIDGDGHVDASCRRIRATSIRSAITVGMRDLAAALGYGWASVGFKPAAKRSGRNEKAAYIFELCGAGVDRYCKQYGLTLSERRNKRTASSKPNAANSTRIEGGYAWLRVCDIQHAEDGEVFDLEIDHEDHSYCTIHGATHNSEVGFWPHADEHAAGVMQAVPEGSQAVGTEVWLESTANGVGNYFHEMWKDAEEGRSDFEAVFIPWYWEDGYTLPVPKGFTLDPEEKEIKALYGLTNGQLAWRRSKIATLKSVELFKQEYPCTALEAFQATSDANFFHPDLVNRAVKSEPDALGRAILSVDVARFGDDRTVIAARQGRVFTNVSSYEKLDLMQVVGRVVVAIRKYRPARVFVDVIGMGAGVVDRLRELGFGEIVTAVNAAGKPLDEEIYFNKRAEMYGELREWLRDDPASIPDDKGLINELCALHYKFDSKGRLQLELKEDLKKRLGRSPDLADALALSFAFPVAAQGFGSFEPGN